MIYIYALLDPRNNQVRYVGKTYNIEKRYYSHLLKGELKAKTHKNCWIKKLLKLGLKPKIKILAKCKEFNSNKLEKSYITKFKKIGKLTNGTMGGDGFGKGSKMPNTVKRRKASERLFIAIDIINKQTLKRRSFKSIKAAAKFINADSSRVSQVLNQKFRSLSVKGYYIVRKGEELNIRKSNAPIQAKAVFAYDPAKNKIYYYESIVKAAKDGYSKTCISEMCDGKRNRTHHRNLIWFWA